MRVLHVVDSLHRENGGLPAVVVRLAVAQTAAGMRPAKGVFRVPRPHRIEGRTVLVLDDVFTTGSTLNECARVLKAAGAAEAHAVENSTGVAAAFRNGLWFALLFGIPLTVALWFVPGILVLFDQPADAVAVAREYLVTMTWALLPYLMFTVGRCFVSAVARPRSVMVIALLAIPLHAAINYCTIFGNFGVPRMEVMGAGLGTAITNTVMMLAIFAEIMRDKVFRIYRPFRDLLNINVGLVKRMVTLGLPVGGLSGVESLFFTAVATMMGWIGTIPLAANQIADAVSSMVFMIP